MNWNFFSDSKLSKQKSGKYSQKYSSANENIGNFEPKTRKFKADIRGHFFPEVSKKFDFSIFHNY